MAKCEFACGEPVLVEDRAVALALYRIAQQAIRHAMVHGHARRLHLALDKACGTISLQVRSEGAERPTVSEEGKIDGPAIMRCQARAVGAELTFTSLGDGASLVTCTVPARAAALGR